MRTKIQMSNHPRVLNPPAPADIAAIIALGGACADHDGFPPFNDQTLVDLQAGRAVIYVPPTGPINAAAVVVDGTVEACVLPDRRDEGMGSLLISAALSDLGAEATVWAHGDLPAAQHLAVLGRLVPVRKLLVMRRIPGPLAQVVLPSGYSLRAFDPARDERTWVDLNAEIFAQHPEQGGMTLEDLRARMRESWFHPADLVFAVQDGEPIGFCWTKTTVENGESVGEIYVLGVRSNAAGRGVGAALLIDGLNRMSDADRQELYVEGDNSAAIHLYEKYGFSTTSRDVQFAVRK